jgi:pheromone shutdown protein TraB
VLATSILSARFLAAQGADGASPSVVAVVGALHVNGVAQRLRSASWREKQATSI